MHELFVTKTRTVRACADHCGTAHDSRRAYDTTLVVGITTQHSIPNGYFCIPSPSITPAPTPPPLAGRGFTAAAEQDGGCLVSLCLVPFLQNNILMYAPGIRCLLWILEGIFYLSVLSDSFIISSFIQPHPHLNVFYF